MTTTTTPDNIAETVQRAVALGSVRRLPEADGVWEVRVGRGLLGWAIASDETITVLEPLLASGSIQVDEHGNVSHTPDPLAALDAIADALDYALNDKTVNRQWLIENTIRQLRALRN